MCPSQTSNPCYVLFSGIEKRNTLTLLTLTQRSCEDEEEGPENNNNRQQERNAANHSSHYRELFNAGLSMSEEGEEAHVKFDDLSDKDNGRR